MAFLSLRAYSSKKFRPRFRPSPASAPARPRSSASVPATVPLVAKNPNFDPTAAAGTANGKQVRIRQPHHPDCGQDAGPDHELGAVHARLRRSDGHCRSGCAPGTAATAADAGYQVLANAVYGFFNNGGSRCYVARVLADADDLNTVLTAFAAIR